MRRIPGIRRLFRTPELSSVERDVDDELAFHFDMRVQELIAQGIPPEVARAEAERRFGDVPRVRAGLHEIDRDMRRRVRREEWLHERLRDVRLALRGFRREPTFAAAVIVTLALGIGANVTMFGIVDRLLLRPPAHVRQPDLVRRAYFSLVRDGDVERSSTVSYPQVVALRESLRPTADVQAWHVSELPLGEGESVRPARVGMATAGLLRMLGVRPALGRFFVEEEDVPPVGTRVAVLSDEVWRRDFGADSGAIGRRVMIAGDSYEMIGVAPRGLTDVNLERVDVWVPLAAAASEVINSRYVQKPWHEAGNVEWLYALVRLPNEGALSRIQSLATASWRAFIAAGGRKNVDAQRATASLEPLLLERGPDRSPSARIAVWLAGMAAVVLLIACANVANLMLARAARRRREVAVRVALGAGRGRLVSQLLTDGVLLALAGGAAAMLIAHWGGGIVRRVLLPGMAWEESLVDPRLLGMTAGVALLTGMLTALAPALHAGAGDLVSSLKAGAREGGGRRSRMRNALVIAQAALSLVLLVGAGLFLRSLDRARGLALGYSADRVLAVDVDLIGAGYATEDAMATVDRLRDRLGALPGVRAAAVAMTVPFATIWDTKIGLPGRDSVALPPSGPPIVNAVSREYFATMGTRIVRGRGFTDADRTGATPVTVINDLMARTLWPGRDALGECVILEDVPERPCAQVIGIAEDVRWGSLQEPSRMQMYTALAQGDLGAKLRVIFVRAAGEPTALSRAIRAAIREEAPRVLWADIQPITENVAREMRPWRLGATMFAIFGGLALLLAALGLYGVIAYDVAQRTREMGIRMALGASTTAVLRLVLRQGVRIAAIGVAIGALIALFAARWVAPLLFETSARDPVVLGGVALVLLAVATAACLIPAWRAARVPPGAALRTE